LGLVEDTRKANKQRRKRYAFYLAIQMPNLEHMKSSVVAINKKGKADYQERAATMYETLLQCDKSCEGKPDFSDCSIACVAQNGQVLANILKCVRAPDQLPF
jgi:hypothetical protein